MKLNSFWQRHFMRHNLYYAYFLEFLIKEK